MTSPAVVVEIAFDSGYTTPAGSRTWTDVTDYWEPSQGLSIGYGRADDRGEVDASTLSLVLDNSDGRFTPGRAASPYYPNVKVGRPIRVKVTPDGGSESVRFVGYVDEWPVSWDGTDAYASVTITATSRTARLGLSSPLRSVIEEEILALDPVAYYTLGEAEGATQAADRMGGPTLIQRGRGDAVTFGDATGPGTDDLTAATFAGGKHLRSTGHSVPAGDATVIFWASTSASSVGWFAGIAGIAAGVDSLGQAMVSAMPGAPTASSVDVNDGGVRLYALRWDSGALTAELLVDDQGVVVSNAGTTLGTSDFADTVFVGDAEDIDGPGDDTLIGSVAHVAVFHRQLSDAEVARLHAAGSDGFAGDTPADRLERYAAYADVPTAEQSFATGTAPIAHVDTTGKGPVELMQTVATADGGVLFDGRDGTLTYLSRDVRYQAATELTLLADSQEIEADYSPKLDRSALLNDLTVSNQGPTVQVRALDSTSRGEYGTFAESLELATDDEGEIHSAAWWRVNTRAEPTLRTPSLSVDLLPLDTTRQDALLALDLSSRVTVTGLPSQAAETDVDYFVEGYTETIGYESYVFTFNVSDAAPWLETLVLDSATRGQLDENTLAY